MAEGRPLYIFPRMGGLTVRLRPPLRREFEAFIVERGWTPEEGVKILLGYAAAVTRASRLSLDEVRNELGAARGELAALRHRAYMADDAIQTLRMNVTGFEKALDQFERTLPRLQHEHDRLQTRSAALMEEALRRGLEVPPDEQEPVPAQRSFLDFYRRNTRGPNDRNDDQSG